MAAAMALQTKTFYGSCERLLQQNKQLQQEQSSSKSLRITAAAWTRKSSYEPSQTKSWKKRTDKFMKPFSMDVYISSRYIHVKVVHRPTSKVVAVASSKARELRDSLASLTSLTTCEVVGEIVAQRCKEADVYAVAFLERTDERLQHDKLAAVLDTVSRNGVMVLY